MSINTVSKIPGRVKIRNVMISVADKDGIDGLVKGMLSVSKSVSILSTGGTFVEIQKNLGESWRENLKQVSEYTGQPEMQGGLVKTLDFKIYLGLLSEKYNDAHTSDLERTGAVEIDMVVGNLYPFKQTISRPDATLENARGNIDIGGPCMLRAAAKNFLRVAAVCDPGDYKKIISEMAAHDGTLSLETRFACAQKAFKHTAEYDTLISEYLGTFDSASLESVYNIE